MVYTRAAARRAAHGIEATNNMASSSTMAAAAAGATVDLSDVSDPTISMLWKRIYSHLSSNEVGQGMAVCKTFKQLLVRRSTGS
jgi:hypothetical protein